MTFTLIFTKEAEEQLRNLKRDRSKISQFKSIVKSLKLLRDNPKHPSLRTHKYHSIKGPSNQDIFEAYAQQKTPSAYRIFFCYGKIRRQIVIISIIPHP